MENSFFTNGYFSLRDEGEIDINRFFKVSNDLAKLIVKIVDKYDDHPSTFYIGNIYRYFRNFKRVSRSEHGRGAKEFNNILQYEGENCYIPSGKASFLKCINYNFKKDFSMEYFEFIQSYKRRPKVMTWWRIPEFGQRQKIDIAMYDLKSKRILPRSVKQRDVCVYIHKNHYCVIWKKNRNDALPNGVEVQKLFNFWSNKFTNKEIKREISR